jgi:hypothetical protein
MFDFRAIDPIGVVSLPGWAVVAAALLVIILGAVGIRRGGPAPVAVALGVAAIVAVTVGLALDRLNARDLAAEARAIEARAFELKVRAATSGSPLACLEATTDRMLQDACEKAVFATAESTAAAVSYVAAQLSVLSAGGKHARDGSLSHSTEMATLRRAIELDRFGIVAHVLAMRTSCRPDACDLFPLLDDSSRISANLAEQPFEGHVKSHMAEWSNATRGSPVVNFSAAPTSPTSVVVRPASKLFFPSASSIPSINIMASEPATPAASQKPHETTASADAAPRPRKPPRATPAPQPATASVDNAQSPSTPLQLAPPAQ